MTEGCQAYGAAASGEKVSVFDAPPENVKLHIGVTRPVWCQLNSSFSPSLSFFLSVVRNPGRFSAPDAKRES